MQSIAKVCVATLLLFGSRVGLTQGRLFARYEARVLATQRDQPHWATPLVTTAPRLEQGLRADFTHQSTAGGQSSWNYGGAKGLQFIPLRHVEMRVTPPPFVAHRERSVADGFGDVAFRLKYRMYGSNEEHHNAIVTGEIAASIPTGKSGNGSCCAVLSPTLEAGKGLRKVDVVVSVGGSLPVSNVARVGRQVIFNSAVQYHATKLLWLEVESNSTLFKGGKSDGLGQSFLTPGVIVSRLPLRSAGPGSAGVTLTVGVGEEIAVTHGASFNHAAIVTGRVRF